MRQFTIEFTKRKKNMDEIELQRKSFLIK